MLTHMMSFHNSLTSHLVRNNRLCVRFHGNYILIVQEISRKDATQK